MSSSLFNLFCFQKCFSFIGTWISTVYSTFWWTDHLQYLTIHFHAIHTHIYTQMAEYAVQSANLRISNEKALSNWSTPQNFYAQPFPFTCLFTQQWNGHQEQFVDQYLAQGHSDMQPEEGMKPFPSLHTSSDTCETTPHAYLIAYSATSLFML